MKTLHILILCTIATLTSCYSYEVPRPTESGAVATRAVTRGIDAQMAAINMALNISEYIDAPDDLKEITKYVYLNGTNPNNIGNGVWVLTHTPYTFYTQEQSLWEAGNSWTILIKQDISYPSSPYTSYESSSATVLGTVKITCIATNKWEIVSSKIYTNGALSSSELLFTAHESTKKGQPFAASLSGKGKVQSLEPDNQDMTLTIDYNINNEQSLILGTGFYFTHKMHERLITLEGGTLQMNCTQPSSTHNGADKITTEFSLASTRITLNGVAETWSGLVW